MTFQQKAAVALIVLSIFLVVLMLEDIDRKLDRQYQVVVSEEIK